MRIVIAALLSLVACTETLPQDADGAGGAGGDEPSCDAPDLSCPADMPFAGAPCEGNLVCHYPDDVEPWLWRCVASRWEGEADCTMLVGGACGVPEPAEVCAAPFGGELAATVAIGPSDPGQPFRPFENGEAAEVEIGPQGGAMIFYRVEVDGQDIPGCISLRTTVTPAGMAPSSVDRPVRLRCGESLSMYVVLPEGGCESSEPVETTVQIEVEGIGSAEVMLLVPGEAFCSALG